MGVFSIIRKIAKVELGTLWAAPNYIWTNVFAKNKFGVGYHPAIVERVKKDNITAIITPGTSKSYKIGSCVFKTKLTPMSKQSHFLLKLSMPYLVEDLEILQNNWNGVERLSDKQISEFQTQITWCKGARNINQ